MSDHGYKPFNPINYHGSFKAENELAARRDKIRDLKAQVDQLYLLTESLWEFIRKDNNLDEIEIFKKVMDIDARDGKIDGKSARPPKKCHKCGHILPKLRPFCLYCGEKHVPEPFDR